MGISDNPFFSFGMFMIMLATAIAFPEISLEWIEFSSDIDPIVSDLFKTGIAFISIAFLSMPLWRDFI